MDKITYYTAMPLERESLLEECAELYSNHYGKWGEEDPLHGNNIKLPKQKLYKWLPNEQTGIYTARHGEKLVGYAIALRCNMANHGIVSWVTQFVVHTDYRHQGIGSNLLRHIWGMSNDYAWGIVTSNPYAVRALEKATRRISDPKIICTENRFNKLLNFGQQYIGNYITKPIETQCDKTTSQINTKFNVDHSTIPKSIESLKNNGVKWKMGELKEAWEWFAFTFRRQEVFNLSQQEIDEILENTDRYTKEAYKRMLGGNGGSDKGKTYTKHTEKEVEFIISECELNSNSLVYDFGCGNGRHSNLLASKKYNVYGIDYIQENVSLAKSQPRQDYSNYANFDVGDCRDYKFDKQADAIICLYDVIGSFTNENENKKIITNIYNSLKTGGTALISVMNKELNFKAVQKFSFNDDPNKIFDLKASKNMGKTGEVFNPIYMLYDTNKDVFYRKEQFLMGTELPVELIVCDRRYTKETISSLCKEAGFEVEFSRYVHAGDWNTDLNSFDPHSKEILVKCIKR
ncbi:MAG: GNAT family N-acetyltransferase [Lachnospiraceae bacterium]|jgi:2-polyprenyl-3-methyl-5-hydroxy-6-metoxy-1,4-benzoquinol methylase/GNAT superfamily N-acetyltransferase|nr:GNAT family N-acetyltransferase [Lachnospiraceae bacterium]